MAIPTPQTQTVEGVRYRVTGEYAGERDCGTIHEFRLPDFRGHSIRRTPVSHHGAYEYHLIRDGAKPVLLTGKTWRQVIRSFKTVLQRERDGFDVDDLASGGARARCIRQGCTWASSAYVNRSAASDIGHRHQATVHTQEYLNRVPTPSPRKDTSMSKTMKQIDRELELAQARLENLMAEKRRLERRPAEPSDDLITFEVRFDDCPGVTYSYAAIRVRHAWWLTGKERGGRTWEELLEFMEQDTRIKAGAGFSFRTYPVGSGTLIETEGE